MSQEEIGLLKDSKMLVHINVYRNENTYSHHWNVCHAYRCNDEVISQDFLLFCNVEAREVHHDFLKPEEIELEEKTGKRHIDLILRSGHHKGKGIKIIRRDSLLGRLFRDKLEKKMQELKASNGSPAQRSRSPKNPNKTDTGPETSPLDGVALNKYSRKRRSGENKEGDNSSLGKRK
jgi:hypothetical protein